MSTRYAIMNSAGDTCLNVVLADAPPEDSISLAGETQPVGPRWKRIGGVWLSPVGPAPVPAGQKVMSRLAFLRRFTQPERKAIRLAAQSNDDLDDFLYLLEVAQEIDLDDPDTQSGVQMLEAGGLIGVGRAAEILSA